MFVFLFLYIFARYTRLYSVVSLIFREQNKLRCFSILQTFAIIMFLFSFLGPNIFLNTLFSEILNIHPLMYESTLHRHKTNKQTKLHYLQVFKYHTGT